jgi:aspartate/methionine/tyrosine aminotransferase
VINTLLHGGRPVFVNLHEEDGYAVDPFAIKAKLSRRTKALILNSPMNPLGKVIPEATFRAIAEAISGTGILLISDEAYERIVYDRNQHFSPGAIPEIRSQVVSIFTFSKTYAMTGWRIGYMAAPAPLLDEVAKVHLAVTGYVNSIAQKAALAALECEADVQRMVEEYTVRRRIVWETLSVLEGLDGYLPEGAFYYFLRTPPGMSSLEAAKMLIQKAGVVLVPGTVFGPSGEGHLRLSFAAPRETLRAAMRGIELTFSIERALQAVGGGSR